ncbi:MAG: heme-copper oxidase subunit III [Candidatus Eisenbacteria bacterium]
MTNGPDPGRNDLPAGTSRFGMTLFLASLSVLFLASLAGYMIIRLRAPEWPPEGTPPLPFGLVWSTVALLASSFTMHRALKGAREGTARCLKGGLTATLLLGLLFLILQLLNWRALQANSVTAQRDLYGFTFFLLTVLHAVHVIGGIAGLLRTTAKAYAGAYTPERHEGVVLVSMYWHFLDVVWLVLFAVLYVGNKV